jgi:subtilase family serine protease
MVIFAYTLLFGIIELLIRNVECHPFQLPSNTLDVTVDGSKSNLHTFREASPGLASPDGITKEQRIPSTIVHEVMFLVKQRNMGELTRILHDVSDPASENYGNHLKKQDIDELTSNPESHEEVVAYLKAAGATLIIDETHREIIRAAAPVAVWERMFNTEFYSYSFQPSRESNKLGIVQQNSLKFIGSEQYSVPLGLDAHISSVANVIDIPPVHQRVPPKHIHSSTFTEASRYHEGYMSPQLLNDVHGISENAGHPRATQLAFETTNNYFSPEDLTTFQKFYGLPIRAVNQSIGNMTRSAAWCKANGYGVCGESNLDIQFMLAMADTPTIHYYFKWDSFSLFLSLLVNSGNPPLVVSISYLSDEYSNSQGEHDAFTENAIKLGAMGVTIVVCSGDDGVASSKARYNAAKCGYVPLYPAGSPYVLTVGATQVIYRLIASLP